jgi:endonuclease G, mitochondrial
MLDGPGERNEGVCTGTVCQLVAAAIGPAVDSSDERCVREPRKGVRVGLVARVLRRPDSAIHIDPDYSTRRGYDPSFLGSGEHAVALPSLPDDLVPLAATNRLATSEPTYVLPYHHFSVVLNKERRLAFFTAVNIDGKLGKKPRRQRDQWFFDPRVTEDEQTGGDIYASNPLDLGHLVRRLDPTWGTSAKAAKLANDDTFHYTNCTPQHQDFNRNKTSWAGLEDYILKNANNLRFKVNVFTGPVLAEDDDAYEGVQLPRQFWKVVTMVKTTGQLSATAYLLSQQRLIERIPTREPFSYGAYKTYQVPVTRVEELTGLSFGLVDADPLATREITETVKELDRPDEVIL